MNTLEGFDHASYYSSELKKFKINGNNQAIGLCPFHNDKKPSLSINLMDGRYNCFGCGEKGNTITFHAKKHAISISEASVNLSGIDLKKSKLPVIFYDYRSEKGNLSFQVVRYSDKSFKARRPNGKNSWVDTIKGLELTPYHLQHFKKSKTIFVCEGEKDCNSLLKFGITASTNPFGAGKWKPEYNKFFKKKIIVIVPDNDPEGKKHAEHVAENLHGIAKSIKIINLPVESKEDVTDWITKKRGNRKKLEKIVSDTLEWKPEQPYYVVRASELENLKFKKQSFLVENLIPQGDLTILASKPKDGKTFLCLNLAIALTTGSLALAKLKIKKTEVLYLALEDTLPRLLERLQKILQFKPLPEGLYLSPEWKRIDEGGLDDLKKFLDIHKKIKLVVVDILQRIRPRPKSNQNNTLYSQDYESIQDLKTLANERNIAILIVHHLRKMSSDDIFDQFSGTFGLSGAADNLMILKRESRNRVLYIRGKNIEEKSFALKFDPLTFKWSFLGDAEEYKISSERQEILNLLKKSPEPLTPSEIAKSLKRKKGNIKFLLHQMLKNDQIKNPEKGMYSTISLSFLSKKKKKRDG